MVEIGLRFACGRRILFAMRLRSLLFPTVLLSLASAAWAQSSEFKVTVSGASTYESSKKVLGGTVPVPGTVVINNTELAKNFYGDNYKEVQLVVDTTNINSVVLELVPISGSSILTPITLATLSLAVIIENAVTKTGPGAGPITGSADASTPFNSALEGEVTALVRFKQGATPTLVNASFVGDGNQTIDTAATDVLLKFSVTVGKTFVQTP